MFIAALTVFYQNCYHEDGYQGMGFKRYQCIAERRSWMPLWKPDPTFYPSPRMAMQAPPEGLAYVAAFNPNNDGRPDAMTVVDVAPNSSTYGQVVGRVDMPKTGDELHHFG